ncbi:MAG: hypothetical protein BGO12_10790 [Verrucomicrobia bacterium 61-8]|nr:MAG: hypothetical protein BGO12_10790 [Verrucomicrobia bacterium 61-8]
MNGTKLAVRVWRNWRIPSRYADRSKGAPQTFFRYKTLGNFGPVERQKRHGRLVAGDAGWCIVIMLVMAAASADSQHGCKRLASPSGASYALLVVKSHRRHICEHHCLESTNVNTDLHCRSDAQQINRINSCNKPPTLIGADIDYNVAE